MIYTLSRKELQVDLGPNRCKCNYLHQFLMARYPLLIILHLRRFSLVDILLWKVILHSIYMLCTYQLSKMFLCCMICVWNQIAMYICLCNKSGIHQLLSFILSLTYLITLSINCVIDNHFLFFQFFNFSNLNTSVWPIPDGHSSLSILIPIVCLLVRYRRSPPRT